MPQISDKIIEIDGKKLYAYNFPRPSVSVDCVIFGFDEEKNTYKVLLIKRKNPPYQNCWALPGGFVEMNETIRNAAFRELKEETGIYVKELNFVGVFDNPERDSRGRVISHAYSSIVNINSVQPKAADDAIDTKWLQLNLEFGGSSMNIINATDCSEIAFDHEYIIKAAIIKAACQQSFLLKRG
jgi:8-oxo-dGTP diphosphatase